MGLPLALLCVGAEIDLARVGKRWGFLLEHRPEADCDAAVNLGLVSADAWCRGWRRSGGRGHDDGVASSGGGLRHGAAF